MDIGCRLTNTTVVDLKNKKTVASFKKKSFHLCRCGLLRNTNLNKTQFTLFIIDRL